MAQQSRHRAATDAHEEAKPRVPPAGRRRSNTGTDMGRQLSAQGAHPRLLRGKGRQGGDEGQEGSAGLPQDVSQCTVCTDTLMATFPQKGSSSATFLSAANTSVVFSDIDDSIEAQTDKSAVRNAALRQYEELGAASFTESRWMPTARIILTHETPHNVYCDKVCLKHFHFLIRILPRGRSTPPSELLVPAVGKLLRRQEELFCMKTYDQIEELRRTLDEEKYWDDSNIITHLPGLPARSVPVHVWFGQEIGRKHNPGLVEDMQTFFDVLLAQPPGGDLSAKPTLQEFFQTDRVPLSHPLVQQVATALGGEFPEFNDEAHFV